MELSPHATIRYDDPVALARSHNLAQRRLSALAQAVRDHERIQRDKPHGVRGPDLSLYKRLREICGERV